MARSALQCGAVRAESRVPPSRGWRRALSQSSLAALLVVAACSVDNKSSSSGLLIQVDSDLATPKDLDRVHVLVTQSGETVLDQNYAIGSNEEPPPINIPLVSRGGTAAAYVDVVGYHLGQVRVERTALTSIPTSRWALLRMRLDYLCLGRSEAAGGDACEADSTCVQGECVPDTYSEAGLPDFQGSNTQTQASAQSVGACFDAVACFENASEAALRDDCSFEINSALAGEQLNVALRLPRGGVGTCGEGACFVPFDRGTEGFSFEPGTVHLPKALCAHTRSLDATSSMTVVFSNSCATKTADVSLCDVSSLSAGNDDGATGMSVITGVPGSSVGPACDGARAKACGMCGTQLRDCVEGMWSDYGKCASEGECKQDQTRACGADGQQTCGGDCRWGDCLGQQCRGNATQACERCGTQARSCDNGVWAQWETCSEQGACSPGETQACGSQGTQACGGNCQWGPCGDQTCRGAPTEACGMCGTRSRECNSASGEWSEFGACSGEGACMPNDTRPCGHGGTQVCGGNCQWGRECSGQTCEGERSMACGNCGTRTRSCDTSTGTWSDWSSCMSQGDCTPDQTRGCGRGGTQVCNGSCRWDSECTGQSCIGAGEQTCGNCGIQTRSCDGSSGTWSDWSSCRSQGECRANSVRSCGSSGSQVCGSDCRWESACSGQMCAGDTSRACGNCGVQRRTCDPSTGRLSDWGPCEDQGRCAPTDTRSCGSQGTQTCGDNCQWQTACTGQVCAEPAQRACGNCGTQTSTCDPNTGRANWSTCRGEGQCEPGTTQRCGSSGVQVCGDTCRWAATCSMQVCTAPEPAAQSCERCGTRMPMCDTNSGEWVFPMQCSNQGTCMPLQTRRCGRDNAGTQVCGDNCEWSDCSYACSEPLMRSCGFCNSGTQLGTCDMATGKVTYGPCMGGGECMSGDKQMCRTEGRTGSRTCSELCAWPTSCTPDPLECTAPPTTPCGMKCGVRSGDCDPTTGMRACVEMPDACEPMSTQPCSDQTGTGVQTCGPSCTWLACTITQPACKGAPNAACGACGDGRTSVDCDPVTHERTCLLPDNACDPSASPKECRTSGGDAGKQTCGSECRWSMCVANQKPCIGSAGDACGLCGQGKLSDTCDPRTQLRTCEISSELCDPNAGPKGCMTRDGEPGNQTCGRECNWSSCVATPKPCIGNAGDACGLCGQGRLSEACDSATQLRTCQIASDVCDPSGGTKTCTTSAGDSGNETCGSDCKWSACIATPKPCIGNTGDPCGPCNQGALSATCNDTTRERTCVVPDSVCDPNAGMMKTCSTSEGDRGGETCGRDCAWSACVATSKTCIGNAGDPCGPCNLGGLAEMCDARTGVRECKVPMTVCTPGAERGSCNVVIGDQTVLGHEVCTQSCAFECQANVVN